MKRLNTLIATLAIILLASTTTVVAADVSPSEGFGALIKPYEKIRLALVDDTTEGVADEAETIAEKAKEIAADAATPEEVKELLPEIAGAASDIAESTELAPAREAFYELSKALVRYRAQVEGERPAVAYCPMAAKSWLQPDGEIGNPYYGQSMARCGEIVER